MRRAGRWCGSGGRRYHPPDVQANPEAPHERAPQEGEPRAQAQRRSQLLNGPSGTDSADHQLRCVEVGDPPDAWRACGFEVDSSGELLLGRTVLRCTGAGPAFTGWCLDGVEEPIDGLPLTAPGGLAAPSQHPNGIVRIDHVVLRSGDVDRTTAALEAAGLEVRGGRSTTSYGAPMRQVFLWAGDVIVELVGPDQGEPTTEEPTTVFGLALVAADIDATAAALGDLLGTPKDAVQPGRRIAGLRGRDVGIGLPLAVMTPHPGSAT